MPSCEGCGTKNGCTCPDPCSNCEELTAELERYKAALSLCRVQRDYVNSEYRELLGPESNYSWKETSATADATIQAILEGK